MATFDDIPYTEVALYMVPLLDIMFEILDSDKDENSVGVPGTIAFESLKKKTQLGLAALMKIISVVFTTERVISLFIYIFC